MLINFNMEFKFSHVLNNIFSDINKIFCVFSCVLKIIISHITIILLEIFFIYFHK